MPCIQYKHTICTHIQLQNSKLIIPTGVKVKLLQSNLELPQVQPSAIQSCLPSFMHCIICAKKVEIITCSVNKNNLYLCMDATRRIWTSSEDHPARRRYAHPPSAPTPSDACVADEVTEEAEPSFYGDDNE